MAGGLASFPIIILERTIKIVNINRNYQTKITKN